MTIEAQKTGDKILVERSSLVNHFFRKKSLSFIKSFIIFAHDDEWFTISASFLDLFQEILGRLSRRIFRILKKWDQLSFNSRLHSHLHGRKPPLGY